jgi:hypothetical protein
MGQSLLFIIALAFLDQSPRIAVIVALIGATGVITGVIVRYVLDRRGLAKSPPKLMIADLTIDEVSVERKSEITGNVIFQYKVPVLHVFLSNTGGKQAIASRCAISVRSKWNLVSQGPLQFGLKPSGSYELVIDPHREAPYDVEVNISHVLPASSSDRFDLQINVEPLTGFEQIYYLYLEVVYGDQRTAGVDCVVVLPVIDNLSKYFLDGHFEDIGKKEEQRASVPDLNSLSPAQRAYWEMTTPWLDEDLSDDGRREALTAARNTDARNRLALRTAAVMSRRQSPRFQELLDEAKATLHLVALVPPSPSSERSTREPPSSPRHGPIS